MTVWQRITRLAVMGVMVGSLTACNLVGWWETGGGQPTDTSGIRASAESALTAFLIGGNYHSQAGAVKVNNGSLRWVQTRRIVHSPAHGCLWVQISCSGVGSSNPEGRVGITTEDTNNDGYISGAADFQPAGGTCGMTDAATASTGAGMPASAIWLDMPMCKVPNMAGTFTSALTEVSTAQAWGGTVTAQSPNAPTTLFRNLPFETMQEIMNSLDSSDVTTELMGGAPMQVANLQVTNLKIGGDSYRPINVHIKLYNWGATAWDMSKEPGLKLMAGWAANKIETLLNRGATSIRMELELNGGVTLTRDSLSPNMVVTEPSFSTVESWRSFATSNLRVD